MHGLSFRIFHCCYSNRFTFKTSEKLQLLFWSWYGKGEFQVIRRFKYFHIGSIALYSNTLWFMRIAPASQLEFRIIVHFGVLMTMEMPSEYELPKETVIPYSKNGEPFISSPGILICATILNSIPVEFLIRLRNFSWNWLFSEIFGLLSNVELLNLQRCRTSNSVHVLKIKRISFV